MTAARIYRAIPLARLGKVQADATVSADSAITALELAKAAMGEGVAFDLCDGRVLVFSYRPMRVWRRVETDDGPG